MYYVLCIMYNVLYIIYYVLCIMYYVLNPSHVYNYVFNPTSLLSTLYVFNPLFIYYIFFLTHYTEPPYRQVHHVRRRLHPQAVRPRVAIGVTEHHTGRRGRLQQVPILY
jgi:hypothetical protein